MCVRMCVSSVYNSFLTNCHVQIAILADRMATVQAAKRDFTLTYHVQYSLSDVHNIIM